MLPIQRAPESDPDNSSLDEVAGRYAAFEDLRAEFQGAALGYPFFAVVLLLLSLATGYYRWSENNTAVQLQVTLIPLTALLAASLHSWVWLFRIRRRLKALDQRMEEIRAKRAL